MTLQKINYKYYINVAEIMNLKSPRKKLQKPRLKRTIIVDKDEWLPLIIW